MMHCPHRGPKVARTSTQDGLPIVFFNCGLEGTCTLEDFGQQSIEGKPIAVCTGCRRMNEPTTMPEPVGDALYSILRRMWIRLPNCGECERMRQQMNAWGIDGCQAHRSEILDHLRRKSDELVSGNLMQRGAGWLTMAVVRAHGYRTVDELLDAAIANTGGRNGSTANGD